MDDSDRSRGTVEGVTSEAAFRDELRVLVRSAARNGVDVTGGWAIESRSGSVTWDVVVTRVR